MLFRAGNRGPIEANYTLLKQMEDLRKCRAIEASVLQGMRHKVNF